MPHVVVLVRRLKRGERLPGGGSHGRGGHGARRGRSGSARAGRGAWHRPRAGSRGAGTRAPAGRRPRRSQGAGERTDRAANGVPIELISTAEVRGDLDGGAASHGVPLVVGELGTADRGTITVATLRPGVLQPDDGLLRLRGARRAGSPGPGQLPAPVQEPVPTRRGSGGPIGTRSDGAPRKPVPSRTPIPSGSPKGSCTKAWRRSGAASTSQLTRSSRRCLRPWAASPTASATRQRLLRASGEGGDASPQRSRSSSVVAMSRRGDAHPARAAVPWQVR